MAVHSKENNGLVMTSHRAQTVSTEARAERGGCRLARLGKGAVFDDLSLGFTTTPRMPIARMHIYMTVARKLLLHYQLLELSIAQQDYCSTSRLLESEVLVKWSKEQVVDKYRRESSRLRLFGVNPRRRSFSLNK